MDEQENGSTIAGTHINVIIFSLRYDFDQSERNGFFMGDATYIVMLTASNFIFVLQNAFPINFQSIARVGGCPINALLRGSVYLFRSNLPFICVKMAGTSSVEQLVLPLFFEINDLEIY